MKKNNPVFAIMIVVFVFLFASCGENNDSSNDGGNDTEQVADEGNDSPLIGKWKAYKAEGVGESSNNDVEYTLNADGTAKVSYVEEYTWEVSGDTLKMIYDSSITIPWIYSIDGDELFLDNPSADQRIWFNKQ